eukprot:7293745-Pyramimonas_sp.AAC.1
MVEFQQLHVKKCPQHPPEVTGAALHEELLQHSCQRAHIGVRRRLRPKPLSGDAPEHLARRRNGFLRKI